jgi:hypothetical protein
MWTTSLSRPSYPVGRSKARRGARWQGCGTGNFLAWSSANSQQADANFTRYGRASAPAFTGTWGGPGVDPRYNGSQAGAYGWGARQAVQAIAAAHRDRVTYRILFMDIELRLLDRATGA